jgi:hypothetical protein
MQETLRALVAATVAALTLGLAAGGASARSLSTSSQQFRGTWRSLELGSETLIRCPVTMEGSFLNRTIAKVARSLIGAITRVSVKQESCTGGTVAAFNGVESYNGGTTSNTLPWHVSYESFEGTLPNITAVNVLFSRFRFGTRDGFGLCAGQYGRAEDNIVFALAREAGGRITAIEPVAGSNAFTLFRTDAGTCRVQLMMRGSGGITQLGTTTGITVTLI